MHKRWRNVTCYIVKISHIHLSCVLSYNVYNASGVGLLVYMYHMNILFQIMFEHSLITVLIHYTGWLD